MTHLLLKKLDYIFVLRPMLFFPGWTTVLAGYFISSNDQLYYSWPQITQINYKQLTLLLLLFALLMGASFLLNQLRDIDSDKKNNKLFIVSEGHISKNSIIVEILLLTLFGLVIAWSIGFEILLLAFGFFILTGYLYNFRPFKFKDKALLSLIANSLMGWFAFAIGWGAFRTISLNILLDAIPYVAFNTALYLFTLLPDVAGDRTSDKKTIAVIYGEKVTIRLAFIMFVFGLVSAVYLHDLMILMVFLLSLPFFVVTVWNYSLEWTVKTTKFGILIFAVLICFKIPFFFILMLTGFFVTRWYFKKRFNFNYPNFKG